MTWFANQIPSGQVASCFPSSSWRQRKRKIKPYTGLLRSVSIIPPVTSCRHHTWGRPSFLRQERRPLELWRLWPRIHAASHWTMPKNNDVSPQIIADAKQVILARIQSRKIHSSCPFLDWKQVGRCHHFDLQDRSSDVSWLWDPCWVICKLENVKQI